MTMLEDALFDLAEHLGHPAGDGLQAAVLRRIGEPARFDERPRSRVRALLATAAAVVIVAGALVVIAPARRAIADWLGIGAVEVRHVDRPLPNGSGPATVPGAVGSSSPVDDGLDLATAQRRVQFAIAVPRDPTAGGRTGITVDARVPGGLVVLTYPRFTLVEIASQDDGGPVAGKFLPPAGSADRVTVGGAPGLWISGAHQITYLDRAGRLQTDTVRRSGPVLLWTRSGVTYRLEGLDRVEAQRIGASVH